MPEFICRICSNRFSDLGQHAKHQRCHQAEKNFKFECAARPCSLLFNTYAGLDVHQSRLHRNVQVLVRLETGNFKCSVATCTQIFVTVRDLCHHVLKEHTQKNEVVVCPLSASCKCVNPLKSMHTHFSRYHRGWLHNFTGPLSRDEEFVEFEDGNNFVYNEEDDGRDVNIISTLSSQHAEPPSFDEIEPQKKKSLIHNLAKFYIMMESEYCLPTATVQAMCEGFTGLLRQNLLLLKHRLTHELEKIGNLSDDVKNGVLNRFTYADALYTAHDKSIAPGPWLCTPTLRTRYYKENFMYVDPIEKDLSFDQEKPTFVYYAPVEDSLNVMFKCPSVQCEIDKSFERMPGDENTLEDYNDGLLYRKYHSHEKTIDILVFQDAFKPTNDSSTVASKHGTLGVYLALGNLPPFLRIKLDAIQLIFVIPNYKTIFKNKLLRKRCWDILVEDLKRLEREGILYKTDLIKVKLIVVLGDNLGQHEVGGFIGSFSAEFFCRFCPITRTRFGEEPWSREPLRTVDDYNRDMDTCTQRVAADPRVRHHRGIKSEDFKCPFHALENFHAAQPALPPCISHDLLSGVVDQDLSAIMHKLVTLHWFQYEHLNALLKEFSYHGNDSRNVPHEVPPSGLSLGGNAVQNWYLLRLLPLILQKHNIQDSSNAYWKLFLSLKEICEYIFAPSISLDQVSYLKTLIEHYMVDRTILGFDKPKDHFINHYADLIVLFGPLKHLWTLPFESTHSFFRTAARNSHNFKNPGKTMTKKHCLYLAYMSAGRFFNRGLFNPIGSQTLNILSFQDIQIQRSLRLQNFSTDAQKLSRITVNSITYMICPYSGWILLGNADEIHLHIGQIKSIILDKRRVVLLLETHIARLLEEYGVYAISKNIRSYVCVEPEKLKNPCLQPVYNFNHKKCFALENTLSWETEFMDSTHDDFNESQ